MMEQFKYVVGDVIKLVHPLPNQSQKDHKYIVIECNCDINNYRYYKISDFDCTKTELVTPFIDATLLEQNTINCSRDKKLNRILK